VPDAPLSIAAEIAAGHADRLLDMFGPLVADELVEEAEHDLISAISASRAAAADAHPADAVVAIARLVFGRRIKAAQPWPQGGIIAGRV
jgi:hypothetical protein